jgi:2-polyprenyl-6-methoxyphenol hydroxylase-like FAD-dependent oxidoreductase
MYDVIVVGARCAGAPTAMLLARKGYRVLVVDKATFPSDVPRGHFIHPAGVARLQRWGVLDQLVASNCPAISRYHLDVGPFALVGSPPPVEGVAQAYGPRRRVLDQLLVEAAASAGVEVRAGFAVEELLLEGERVTGIRGHTAGGAPVTERARLVVGADGMRSLVARTVQAALYQTKPPLTCAYFSYWSGVPCEAVEIYGREQCALFAFPTHDDLTCLTIEWPVQAFEAIRADIEGHFLKVVEQLPHLAERVQHGRREERFLASGDLPNFYRKPFGPGWALVGDAGYHKDPYLAQGITDAFRDVELLTEAIDAGLVGRRPLEGALADYEQQRNKASQPLYELNSELAQLAPHTPEGQRLFEALRGNQTETDRYFGTFAGTVPLPVFFAPAHLEQLFARSRR